MLRDGYQCVVTGCYGTKHPELKPEMQSRYLRASHILKRAIAVFERDSEEASISL
jgi:hypothetical protein